MAMATASGDYSGGAMIPITRSFVQTDGGSPVTTAYTLVGQVLYNGQTNWVGYNQGSAEYLMTSSADNAEQTTLADGNTYYVSSGDAPAGYLAGVTMTAMNSGTTESAGTGTMSSDTAAPTTSSGSDSDSDSSDSSQSSSSPSDETPTASDSAAGETSSPSSGHRLAAGTVFAVAIGLVAAFSMNLVA